MNFLYFKIALRYLLKNSLYSFINIFGLAIGIASFVMIMLYVNYERSYDQFKGSEQVYRVFMDFLEGERFEAGDAQTANLIGPTLVREFPEVLNQVRLYRFEKITFKYGKKIFEDDKGALADGSYFDIFQYPMPSGYPETALSEPNTIVLTESLAKKIFGNGNPLNQTLSAFYFGEEALLTVTGVLKDIPQNTHMKTNFLISMETYNTWFASEEERTLNWSHCNFYTYLKLEENTNYELLKAKVIASDFEDDEDERYNIEPMSEIHLYSNKPYEAEVNGSISRIKFLTAIAFIVLLLSWLNYINLSTTKSLERAKEVGIRKVAGAKRAHLILGSLMESILLNLMAVLAAVIIILGVLSVYKDFVGIEFEVTSTFIIRLLPILGIVFLGVILAGLYPAFLLSNYSPIKALKGKIRTSAGGLHVRKGLIVLQFLATIVLLIGTLVVTQQIDFLQDQPIGADLNRVVSFQGELLAESSDSLIRDKYRTLEGELKALPFVDMVSRTQSFPGDGYENLSSFVGMVYPNGTEDSHTNFYNYAAHPAYFDILNIQFLAGDNFVDNPNGKSETVIINADAMRKMQISNPQDAIGKTANFMGRDWTISGVVENYHHFGLKSPIQPIIILHYNSSTNLLVKFDRTITSTASYSSAISQVEQKWMSIFPQSTFNYTFLDKKFEAQYQDDRRFSAAFRIFTLLAIFIACLGLFGLTSYTAIQRKKEIGIRKVNGASILQILSLLNKDFFAWVGIAFVVAIPIAWYTMNNWLSNFAYKTTLSWWMFAMAGITVLGVAILTASWHSFKAAATNPVETLRDE